MIDLAALIAQHMQNTLGPDKPPAQFRPGKPQGPTHPIKFETYQKPDGTWGLRPIAYGPGKAKAPVTKVSYTPYP